MPQVRKTRLRPHTEKGFAGKITSPNSPSKSHVCKHYYCLILWKRDVVCLSLSHKEINGRLSLKRCTQLAVIPTRTTVDSIFRIVSRCLDYQNVLFTPPTHHKFTIRTLFKFGRPLQVGNFKINMSVWGSNTRTSPIPLLYSNMFYKQQYYISRNNQDVPNNFK